MTISKMLSRSFFTPHQQRHRIPLHAQVISTRPSARSIALSLDLPSPRHLYRFILNFPHSVPIGRRRTLAFSVTIASSVLIILDVCVRKDHAHRPQSKDKVRTVGGPEVAGIGQFCPAVVGQRLRETLDMRKLCPIVVLRWFNSSSTDRT